MSHPLPTPKSRPASSPRSQAQRRRHRRLARLTAAVAAACGIGLTGQFAHSAVPAYYWTGEPDSSWSTNIAGNTNWSISSTGTPEAGSIPGLSADVFFSATGAANRATTLGANFLIHSMTIDDPLAVAISSGAGGPFTLSIAATLTVNTGAKLTVNSDLTLTSAVPTIAVNGTGTATINGALTSAGGLTKTGAGTLTLAGNNNVAGTTQVDDGTVELQGPSTNTMVQGPLVVGNNAGATSSAVVKLLAANQIGDAVAITVSIDGQLNTNGFAEHVGVITTSEGNVQIAGTGPGGALTVDGLDMHGGSINGGSGTNRLILNGNVTATSGPGIPSFINSPLDLGGATRIFTVNPGGVIPTQLFISGSITNGALAKEGTGVLQFSGTATNDIAGGVFVNNGGLELNKTVANAAITGPLTIGDGPGASSSASVKLLAPDQIAEMAEQDRAERPHDEAGPEDAEREQEAVAQIAGKEMRGEEAREYAVEIEIVELNQRAGRRRGDHEGQAVRATRHCAVARQRYGRIVNDCHAVFPLPDEYDVIYRPPRKCAPQARHLRENQAQKSGRRWLRNY